MKAGRDYARSGFGSWEYLQQIAQIGAAAELFRGQLFVAQGAQQLAIIPPQRRSASGSRIL